MNTYSFRKDLISVQEELLRFAYKLTADKEEANDLLQETSLKALDNEDKYMPDTNFKGGCTPLCGISLLIITAELFANKLSWIRQITFII